MSDARQMTDAEVEAIEAWRKLMDDQDWPLASKRRALEGVAKLERSRGREVLADKLLELANTTTLI